MRAPAATVSEPAFRSPITTPVCSKSTREASSTLPSSSPAIVTCVGAHAAGQLGAGLDGEIALDADVALELAGDAYAAAAFDLAFDGDVGGDQRFLAGQAGVGACHRSDVGAGDELGLRRSVEPGRFTRFGAQPRGSAERLNCLSRWTWRRAYQEGGLLRLALKGARQ